MEKIKVNAKVKVLVQSDLKRSGFILDPNNEDDYKKIKMVAALKEIERQAYIAKKAAENKAKMVVEEAREIRSTSHEVRSIINEKFSK